MKSLIVITVVMLCLVGFVSVVSAELGLINYDYSVMNSDITTREAYSNYGAQWWPKFSQFYITDITDYPSVTSMVVGVFGGNYLTSDNPYETYGECSFYATISGVTVGNGDFYFSRNVVDGSSSSVTVTLVFDTWDVLGMTGGKTLKIHIDDSDCSLNICQMAYARSIVTSGTLSPFYLNAADGANHKSVNTVYQNIDFHQSLSYSHDFDKRLTKIKLNRYEIPTDCVIVDQTRTGRLMDKTDDDIENTFDNVTYLNISLANPYTEDIWYHIIPMSIQYDFLEPGGNSTLSNVPDYQINLTSYRDDILAIPVIGNMSEPYLNFVDDMYTDALMMAKNVIDTLMYPIDLINENLGFVISTLQNSINDISDSFTLLTAPMVKIVTAIPEKVMGFFIFALGLDIVKVVLAWRV